MKPAGLLLKVYFLLTVSVSFTFAKSAAGSTNINEASDSADYFRSGFLQYRNYVYTDNIKTVRFYPPGAEMLQPIIRLNTTDVLLFSFDDLDAGLKTYSYKIVHCSFDWRPSDLLESMYEQGYPSDHISDFRSSFNTIQRYTHYQFIFPNGNLQPTISGNYLLIVFRDDDESNVVITRRFFVLDQKVTISAGAHRATVINDRRSKQEVDFSIFHEHYKIDNPFEDFKVALYQNDRTDNVITGLKPLFLKDQELEYDYEEGNVFNGGNEFRFFDTRSLRTHVERVSRIEMDSTGYHVFLVDDSRRSSKIYSIDEDINGSYIVKTYDGKADAYEADYCHVHFRLPMEAPFTSGNVYVFGSFTDWATDYVTKMSYNENEQAYEASLFLKQGYYNYQYVFVEDGNLSANETEIEGNHFETENDYMICVYNKPVGSRYDELIGIKRLNSLRN